MGIIYVLIIAVHIGYGAAVTTQEFNSKDKCEIAGKSLKEKIEGFNSAVDYICVEK